MTYIDNDSLLHRLNPIVKFLHMIIMTIMICMSYSPIIPIFTFIYVIIVTIAYGNISYKVFLSQLRVFVMISCTFMVSLLILRGISNSPDPVFSLAFFTWSTRDIVNTVTLGSRILAFVSMSVSFVSTTKPKDIVLSLIMQCKLNPVHGYSIMAAYRFIPELRGYIDSIHFAQSIRGIDWSKGINRYLSPFKSFTPMFCLAARRGERIAYSMESRGLGCIQNRSYYAETRIRNIDIMSIAITLFLYLALTLILIKKDLFYFSFSFAL